MRVRCGVSLLPSSARKRQSSCALAPQVPLLAHPRHLLPALRRSCPLAPGVAHQVVQDYLQHYGFACTLAAFQREAGLPPTAQPKG